MDGKAFAVVEALNRVRESKVSKVVDMTLPTALIAWSTETCVVAFHCFRYQVVALGTVSSAVVDRVGDDGSTLRRKLKSAE